MRRTLSRAPRPWGVGTNPGSAAQLLGAAWFGSWARSPTVGVTSSPVHTPCLPRGPGIVTACSWSQGKAPLKRAEPLRLGISIGLPKHLRRPGGLNSCCLLSQFRSPGARGQGVGRVGISECCQGESVLGLCPWLVGDCLLSVSSCHLPSVHGRLWVRSSPFYKDTAHMGVGPTLMTPF